MSAATCRVELCLSVLKESVPLIAGEKQPEGDGWLDLNKTHVGGQLEEMLDDFCNRFRERGLGKGSVSCTMHHGQQL